MAFGTVGQLPNCATAQTCTAATGSVVGWSADYSVTAITAGYNMPTGLIAGHKLYGDGAGLLNNTPVLRERMVVVANPVFGDFFPTASARAQSDFGVQHAQARTDPGVGGVQQQTPSASARIDITMVASASSAWRDVWSFGADGHFSALGVIDGLLDTHAPGSIAGMVNLPLSRAQGLADYRFTVWDVDHYSADVEGVYGPTEILDSRFNRSTASQSGSFHEALALEFDFEAGTHYVVTTELLARGFNGGNANLYNTARMQDVVLTGGAAMNTLSGHNFLTPVPEPQTASLLAVGLAALAWCLRRRMARAEP